jgi:hypothetical protein
MKTRIEVHRFYDRKTKEYFDENPILVKPHCQDDYRPPGGLFLHERSEVFYDPNGKPRVYIETDGPISQIDGVEKPTESRYKEYAYVFTGRIGEDKGPPLIKRANGKSTCGYHIKINGPSKINFSRTICFRPHVHVWIEAERCIEVQNGTDGLFQ